MTLYTYIKKRFKKNPLAFRFAAFEFSQREPQRLAPLCDCCSQSNNKDVKRLLQTSSALE